MKIINSQVIDKLATFQYLRYEDSVLQSQFFFMYLLLVSTYLCIE